MSEARHVQIAHTVEGDATLLRLAGAIDETFTGFDVAEANEVVVELGGLTRITSYGVHQWMHGRNQLAAKRLYYLNCPPFFVDQLNMVLNFGGAGQVITAFAPFSCAPCKSEQWALIDVLRNYDELSAGKAPGERCPKCGAPLQMDELPATYFGFVRAAGARALTPAVASLLQSARLYSGGAVTAEVSAAASEHAQVRKLVHERVTYLRISGTIDGRFRARSLLEGIEGEVVVDLRHLCTVGEDGGREWDRLRAGLAGCAVAVTLVDVPSSVLEIVQSGKLSLDATVVYSVLAPYQCLSCGHGSDESVAPGLWSMEKRICTSCGGLLRYVGKPEHMVLASRLIGGPISAETRVVIERREDLLSRALVEAEAVPEARKAGSVLGRYEIIRAISLGGTVEVLLAVQKGIGGFEKPVTLKRIRRSVLQNRDHAVEQFLNEAKVAAALTHPDITQILDVGEENGLLYLAVEYVHGKDLRALSSRLEELGDKLPLGTALYIAQQIARALHHAHTTVDLNGRPLKAIHGSVSPENILVGFDGGVRLVDFGLSLSTLEDDAAGKNDYVSPERQQALPLDERSDLFSLGVVLYETIAGELPFEHGTPSAVNPAEYRPVSRLRKDMPKAVDDLLAQMLAMTPASRIPGDRLPEVLAALAMDNEVCLDDQWVRANMPSLFPSALEPNHTSRMLRPDSDSISVEPPARSSPPVEPTTPLTQASSPGAASSVVEREVYQAVSALPNRAHPWIALTLVLLTALLGLLWWRY